MEQNQNVWNLIDYLKVFEFIEKKIKTIEINTKLLEHYCSAQGLETSDFTQILELQKLNKLDITCTHNNIIALKNKIRFAPTNERIKRSNEISHLVDKFEGYIRRFQSSQRSIAKSRRSRLKSMKSNSNVRIVDLDTQFEVVDFENAAAEAEEDMILNLENDVRDINRIFHDLGLMVDYQGGHLDSVEEKITGEILDDVLVAVESIQKARDIKTKAMREKILIVVISILLIIVIIILVVVLKKNA